MSHDGLPWHVVAVTAFVRDRRGRVLLADVTERGWELPGGCVEAGEDVEEAVRREVAEETGCIVAARALIGVHTKLTPPQMVLLHFECEHLGGEPGPGDGTSAAGWFEPEQALSMVQREPAAGRLRDALRGGAGIVHRVYRTRPFELVAERRLG